MDNGLIFPYLLLSVLSWGRTLYESLRLAVKMLGLSCKFPDASRDRGGRQIRRLESEQ